VHDRRFCNFFAEEESAKDCRDGRFYNFSRLLNPLDYDPAYHRNPGTLGQYIRKYRKDKGLLIRELAEEIGVHKFTLIKWEGGKQAPRYGREIGKLVRAVLGAGRFLYSK
jgi:DNA-binding XRE family transcriptional regulator